MNENTNMEELLNSYIDGELTEPERLEVERMLSGDAQLARRLRELEKCKMLVGSLPNAEAPADMRERIKASLDADAVPAGYWERLDERKGARHLLARRVLAAAAMVGLAAILAGIVYSVLVPEIPEPVPGFSGILELTAGDTVAVAAVIDKSIVDNSLSDLVGRRRQADKRVYTVSCSREELGLLLADLENVWENFESTRLVVESQTAGERVLNNVTPAGIVDLMTPAKPKLTGKEQEPEEPPILAKDEEKVSLTIVVGAKQ